MPNRRLPQDSLRPVPRHNRWRGLLLMLVIGLTIRFFYEKGLVTSSTISVKDPGDEPLVKGSLPVRQDLRWRVLPPPSEIAAVGQKTKSAPQSVRERVRELTDAGESAAAVALLEEALRQDPNNITLLMELGIIQVLDFKNQDRGQKIFERIVNLDPLQRGALNELLVLYEDQGKVAEGLDFLRAHLTIDGDVSEVQYAYAKLLVRAGKQAEAIDSFEAATTSIRDAQDQVYLDLAEAAMSVGRPERAVTALETAIRLEEQELERAKERKTETVDFIEDRIVAAKVSYARALLRMGRIPEAAATVDSISGRDDDPLVASARREIQARM